MRFVIIILLFLLPSTVFAGELPFDFKGIALGSNISSIEGNSKFSCRDSQDPIWDKICTFKFSEFRETIAGEPVKTIALYYYYDKLESISILLDSKYFSNVAAALTEKYGMGNIETQVVKNSMGGTFENKIYSWSRDESTLRAKRYSGRLDRSTVSYTTDFFVQEFDRRRNTTIKKKSNDL